MHGGVAELCADWNNVNYYKKLAGKTSINPTGPVSGTAKVIRGGNSFTGGNYGTSSFRFSWVRPEQGSYDIGFRVLQVID